MKITGYLKYWPGQTIEIDSNESYKIFLKNPTDYCIGLIQASNITVKISDYPAEIIPNIIKAKLINGKNWLLTNLEEWIKFCKT